MMFSLMPAWGLSNAAATLVGQSLGAKLPERAKKAVRQTSKYNALFMGVLSFIFWFWANEIIWVFTRIPAVVEIGTLSLQVFASGYIFYAFGMVIIQAFNGAGDTQTPTKINFFCFWLFQIPLAYLTALYFEWGPLGVLVTIVVSEIALTLMSAYYFSLGKWKNSKV